MKILLTHKLGMMSIIDDQGLLVPLTILAVQPNFITQIKKKAIDGYEAIQISAVASRKVKKPQIGHLKKAKIEQPLKCSRELRVASTEGYDLGKEVNWADFKVGDPVTVTGTTKGKGFAGGIKRHNFSTQRKSHGGQKGRPRSIGSIGMTWPSEVKKGKKMPGQMGGTRCTTKGLKIGLIDTKRNLIGIRGAVPGPRRSLVIVKGF